MQFAAVQFDIAWEDKPANHATIERMLSEADPPIRPGAFVVLPELGDTGFSMNVSRIADGRTVEWASDLAMRLGVHVQPGYAKHLDASPAEPVAPKGRNCAAIIDPQGKVLGEYQKLHPFSYGKESQHYSGGDHVLIRSCGMGPDSPRVCPMICYDLRFPELWRLATVAGAEVFTIGASWPAARQGHWRALCIARAIENQAYVIALNRCGRDPHLSYAGGSLIVSPRGEIVVEANSAPMVIQAEVDITQLRAWRAEFPALRDVHLELLGSIRQE